MSSGSRCTCTTYSFGVECVGGGNGRCCYHRWFVVADGGSGVAVVIRDETVDRNTSVFLFGKHGTARETQEYTTQTDNAENGATLFELGK